jgi:HD-GYP domain-containing protein (c-di-GMP phosphodiesterase class II)
MSNNADGLNGMDKFYRQTIAALVAAASERDSIAEAHSERVRAYATAIAAQMGMISIEELKNIGYAASLHDIGKVAVSSKILNKLGRLTEDEFKVMREHSLVATRILDKIEGLKGAIPYIRHHHERFDGSGYPDGLVGEAIPVGARIIAVAEAYDILTSAVPWREALSRDDAKAEIESCAGTQFDPAVVNSLRPAIEALNGHTPQ